MGSLEESHRGHACIVVGEARKEVARTGLRVQVNRLVELLRQEGAAEEYLQAVAVVLYSATAELVDGGGAYYHNATLNYRAGPASPSRLFTTVIHVNIETDRPLPFVVLHEAGHVKAFSRGKGGKVLYGPRNCRWVQRAGWALLALLAVAWTALSMLSALTTLLQVLAIVAVVVGMAAATMPDAVLWLASTAEWKANWFYWRHRKVVLVGQKADGTEMLNVAKASINGAAVH
jgi:hypothetical protein